MVCVACGKNLDNAPRLEGYEPGSEGKRRRFTGDAFCYSSECVGALESRLVREERRSRLQRVR